MASFYLVEHYNADDRAIMTAGFLHLDEAQKAYPGEWQQEADGQWWLLDKSMSIKGVEAMPDWEMYGYRGVTKVDEVTSRRTRDTPPS